MDNLYSHLDIYEKKRRELLGDIKTYIETEHLRKGFMGDFMAFFREVIFRMVNSGDDYFALFLGKLETDIDFSLKWPLATIEGRNDLILKVNPVSFLYMRENEAEALLKHEVFHLILNHHSRERVLKKIYSKMAVNLALDVAVNQYLRDLPPFAEKISTVNIKLGTNLKFNETLEFYAEEIDKALKDNPEGRARLAKKGEIDFSMVHDAWAEDSDAGKDEKKERLDAIMKYSSKGGIPKELESILKEKESSKVRWTDELRKAISTTPSGKRKTITRRNRRQPERIELKGELSNYIPEIIIAIDISGSINDKEAHDYVREVVGLFRHYGKEIRIIECDNMVRKDYKINSLKELRPLEERRGGTAFSPVFELLRKENRKDSLLIYFTDGQGEERLSVRPINQTLWVLTGDKLSLSESFGKIINISKGKTETERAYGIEAMRELLHEWAR